MDCFVDGKNIRELQKTNLIDGAKVRKIETDCLQGKLKKCLPDLIKFILDKL